MNRKQVSNMMILVPMVGIATLGMLVIPWLVSARIGIIITLIYLYLGVAFYLGRP